MDKTAIRQYLVMSAAETERPIQRMKGNELPTGYFIKAPGHTYETAREATAARDALDELVEECYFRQIGSNFYLTSDGYDYADELRARSPSTD